jgi:hypothetical protein
VTDLDEQTANQIAYTGWSDLKSDHLRVSRTHSRRLVKVQGDLVRTGVNRWIIEPPTHCANGHPLGPNQVLVGHEACLGHGGGHTTWTCRLCDHTEYGPPTGAHCTTLNGPARVR